MTSGYYLNTDGSGNLGFFMVEDQNSGQLGFYNLGSSSYAGLNANSYTISILTAANGSLYTYATQNTSLGSAIGLTPRNTLDNGSGDMSIAGSLTVNGGSLNNLPIDGIPIQFLASDNSGVSFPEHSSYNIVAIFSPLGIKTTSSGDMYVSCWAIEHNSGGGTTQYLVISDTQLSAGISYSSVTYALELTGYSGQTGDSTSDILFFASSGVALSANTTYYLYYAVGNTGYTHYLAYATALVSFA